MVAQTLTTPSQDDASQGAPLLGQVEQAMDRLSADGAYDKRKVFDAFGPQQGRPIRPIMPPRKDAQIAQHGNTQAEPLAR